MYRGYRVRGENLGEVQGYVVIGLRGKTRGI